VTGFDNGTLQSGVFAQAKQFGPILRGSGPPVPAAGVVGDLYIDTQTWFLYEKRSAEATDPWGHYLFAIPAQYQSGLNWFSSSLPTNNFGANGDYCLLWAGFNNYGLQPSICGPNVNGYWPESGDGPDLLLDPTNAGYTIPAGLTDEGALTAFSNSWQLVVAGLDIEYVMSIPVPQMTGTSVIERGFQNPPAVVPIAINPLYTAEDEHAI
jgi:hypothetical protein